MEVKELAARHDALKQERMYWEADWKSLAKYFLPRKCRLLETEGDETNRSRLRTDILSSVGIYAMRDLAAGMHGGMTSPARPWFRLGLQDEVLEAKSGVRSWLDDVQNRMRVLLHRSNFYNAIHHIYEELGTFGIGFMFAMGDPHTGVRFSPLTAGEYCVDVDEYGRVDTVFRVLDMNPRQLVRMFGYDKMPDIIKNQFDNPPTLVERFRLVHAVMPRNDRDPFKMDAKNKPFASYYYLDVGKSGSGRLGSYTLLSVSGFDEFPGFGPRWDVTGQDVYGRSPGMDALADNRMVQSMSYSALSAMQYETNPPLAILGQFKNLDLTPGGINPITGYQGSGQPIYPIHTVSSNGAGTMQMLEKVENSIKEGLFNNLFRLLMNSDRRQITAKEVSAREEEKLILIGPVIERLHDEMFTPLIDRVFNIMIEQNMVPPWPTELEGQPIKVEFVSLLAQAQKMVSTGAVDQFVGFIGGVSQLNPDFLDVLNPDKIADGYAGYLGVEVDMLRPTEERVELRKQRQQQAQAMQQMQAMQAVHQGAQTAKTLSDTPTGSGSDAPPSALQALLGGMAQGVKQ